MTDARTTELLTWRARWPLAPRCRARRARRGARAARGPSDMGPARSGSGGSGRRCDRRAGRRPTREPPAPRRPSPRGARSRLRLRLLRPVYAVPGLATAVRRRSSWCRSSSSSPAPISSRWSSRAPHLAPTAHGNATLTKTGSGWRIALSARGLPHLANGSYYEAWLKSAAGVLVPVGTFNDARQVTLWAGVPPTQFPSLTVTRQQANGHPASSGQRVLVGTISAPR